MNPLITMIRVVVNKKQPVPSSAPSQPGHPGSVDKKDDRDNAHESIPPNDRVDVLELDGVEMARDGLITNTDRPCRWSIRWRMPQDARVATYICVAVAAAPLLATTGFAICGFENTVVMVGVLCINSLIFICSLSILIGLPVGLVVGWILERRSKRKESNSG